MKTNHISTCLLISLFGFTILNSCTKDKSPDKTKTPEELLTANTWQIEKIRTLANGSFYLYQRGTSNHDLDNENITFKTDHTGSYTGPDGTQYVISSWN